MRRVAFTVKPRKYRNTPTTVDGIRFDSLKEARRYQELRLLEKAGEIGSLETHPTFPLHVSVVVMGDFNGVHRQVGHYTADFGYRQNGQYVVEDVKSPSTRKNTAYRLRKRMVEAQYGFTITEV